MNRLLYSLAVPVSGNPEAPPGTPQSSINSFWGYWTWGIIIVGTFALAGCAILAYRNSRNGEGNEGVERGAKILAGMIALGLIPGVVGQLTGT